MDWSVWNSDGDVTLRYRIQSNWTISTAYYYNQHCLVQTCRHLEAPAQSKVPQTIVKRGESSKNNNQAAIILVLTLVYYRSADLEQSCQYIYITFTFQFDSVFIRTEPDISLHFSALLCISLNFYAFLYIPLRFSAFLYISLHFSAFFLHYIFWDNLTERTVVLWTPFFAKTMLHNMENGVHICIRSYSVCAMDTEASDLQMADIY